MIGQPVRRSTGSLLLYPTYVQDYLDRVTTNDVAGGNAQGLERGVTDAFNVVLQDLVADTILGVSGGVIAQEASLSKALPFMCGARTITGCLTPVVGPAPTNINFTGVRYNRKTGLLGDGATTHLLSNYDNSADPQNDKHIAVWQTEHFARNATRAVIGTGGVTGSSVLVATTSTRFFRVNHGGTSNDSNISDNTTVTGFWGASRNSATSLTGRYNSTNYTFNIASAAPAAGNIFVFSRGTNSEITNGRLSSYSIGRHLNLSVLEARIAELMNTLAALSL
jgi:hypothetical protein